MNKNLVILVFCRLLQISVSLLSLRVMTTLLNERQIGQYYVFMSLFMLATLSVINPVGQYISRNINKWKKEGNLITWLKRYIIFVIAFSLLFISIYRIWLLFFDGNHGIKVLILSFLYISVVSLNQFILYSLNILGSRFEFSILTVITAFLSLLFGYLFYDFNVLGKASVYSWISGLVAANLFIFIISWSILKRKEPSRINIKDRVAIKEIMRFSIPIGISTFFMWILNAGYRFGIEPLVGLEYLGIIAVCFSVSGQIMTVVESLVTQVLQPQLFRQLDHLDRKKRISAFCTYMNECISIYFSILLFGSIFMFHIFLLLIDKKYIPYAVVGIIALWSEFFRASTNAIALYFFGEKQMQLNIYPYLIGATFLILAFLSIGGVLKDYHLFLSLPLIIAIANMISLISCFLLVNKHGALRIKLIFLLKRVLVVSPALMAAYLLPDIALVNFSQVILIGAISFFYGALFLLSLMKIEQQSENES
ncbi:TPA: oligosaccharide flippase family protein [Kluyvera georgiana]|nr:oligosaccharide flippase family protein [Kluyvera georgiana]